MQNYFTDTGNSNFMDGFDQFDENTEESLQDDATIQEIKSQGTTESLNLIPSGIGSSHFYYSGAGDPLWTYADDQSYLDPYWGVNPSSYSTQIWNPENKYMQDSISQIPGSTDFDDWTDGVGSIRLDAPRRDHTFRINDSNTQFSLSDAGGTPDPTGYYNSSYDSGDGSSWGDPEKETEFYPGNMEGFGGTDYLATNEASFMAETWDYGNTMNSPGRGLENVNSASQSYDVTAKRYTWYELYYNGFGSFDRISTEWDTTFDYQTEFRMYFDYSNTTASTQAFYGADISLTGISNTEQSGVFDVDITGTIQYDVFKNGTTPTQINAVSQTRNFEDDPGDGSFPSDASVSITESDNFGAELDSGIYYFRILVNITHHMDGSHTETQFGGVSEYFSDEIGITVEVSNPYVSISESTPIHPETKWGSTKIDPDLYDTIVRDIEFDSTTSTTSVGDATFSHSIGYGLDNARLLVATVSFEDSSPSTNVSTVSYDGQTMVRLADEVVGTTYTNAISQWYLLDANLPATSGSYTVNVDMVANPNDDVMVSVSNYINVNQSGPTDVDTNTAVSSSTISTSVDTESDNSLVISAVVDGSGSSVYTHTGSLATKRWFLLAGSAGSAGGDMLIPNAGVNNIDEYVYGTSANRMAMISSSWAPYVADPIYPEQTYKYMGSTSPDIGNMNITNLHIYITNDTTISIGLWMGRILTDPSNADIVFNQTNIQATRGWNDIAIPSTPWDADINTWIGFATNGSGYVPYTTNVEFTHFSGVTGAWNQTSPTDADPTGAMPLNIGAGEFIPVYYAVYLEYEKDNPDQSLVSIESDWVDWGENRHISTSTIMNLTFGYQIPLNLRGYDGVNKGLEYGKIIANLTIDKGGQLYNFSQTASNTFADVRNTDLGYGLGCDKFSWNMSNEIKIVLNSSTRIKWHIGVRLESQFEMGYNFSIGSQIYFNNINCTVDSERPIYGTFDIQDLEGNPEYPVNITIFDENNIANVYYVEDITDAVMFNNLTLGQWRVIINKTITGTGQTVVIYNSTKEISIEADFSDILQCNLTNIIFKIRDYDNNLMTGGAVTLSSKINPTVVYTSPIDGIGQAFFPEVYNDDWQMTVTAITGNIVLNFTKNIDSLSLEIPASEKYLITDSAYTTYQINLTNIELNVLDPTNLAPAENLRIQFTNANDNSIVIEETTNSSGNATLREVFNGNWNFLIYSANNYVIYNQSNYQISSMVDLIHDTVIYNLTNLEFWLTDYSGDLLSNDVSPIVQLTNIDDDLHFQHQAVDGLVTFSEVYNGSNADSWRVSVTVDYQGEDQVIFNSSYSILTNLDVVVDTLQANLTKFKLTIYDRDNNAIEGASVNLTDSTDPSSTYESFTDRAGRINIDGFYDSQWIIDVKYIVKGANSLLQKEFSIYSDNSYGIGMTGAIFETEEFLFNCNLTTIELYVLNHEIDRQYAGLYKANITISNHYINENITTLLTDPNGYTSIIMPSGRFNFSVVYQGASKDFHFNDTGDLVDRTIHNKTISYHAISDINITLTGAQTQISIQDIYFGNTGVTGWDGFNGEEYGESYQITTFPYQLNLYKNDSVEFEFFFEEVSGHTGIETNVFGSWNLTKDGEQINSSADIGALDEGSGYYNLSLFTQQRVAGTYELNLELSKTSYLTSYYTIIINILNHTTSLERIYPVGIIKYGWHENMVIRVNYTTVLPEFGVNITEANVRYSISGTLFQDEVMTNPSEIYADSGVYELNISKRTLDVGIYTMVVYASKGNFTGNSITIVFEITPVNTQSSFGIISEYLVTPTYMKVAYGENFTVFANFSYYIPGDTNYSALINVNFVAYLNTPSNPVDIYDYTGDWQFRISKEANLYSVGAHTLYIIAEGDNHETQIIQITVEILNYWDSAAEIINNPYITPWANNATFVIEYGANEEPRTQTLDDAEITQLRIYYIDDGQPIDLMILTAAQTQFWSWSPLSAGQYQIWINTSIIEITDTQDIYIVPSINYSIYAEASTEVLLWITPLESAFTLYSGGEILSTVDLILDESIQVDAQLNITETTSGLLGFSVDGATVSYEVYNISNSQVVELGSLSFTSDGIYQLFLDATKIGNFTVKINMFLKNHTLVELGSFTLRVGVLQAQYSISIDSDYKISDVSLKVALGENISFIITYDEILAEFPELIVSIGDTPLSVYYFTGSSFLCTHPASDFTSGEYTIEIVSDQAFANPVEKSLELEIVEYWNTVLITDPFDFSIVPWNNITQFSVQYVCTEAPRDGLILENANITGLQIRNSDNELLHTLTELERGTLWDWSDILDGNYEIWLNTSFLYITEQEALFVNTEIHHSVYNPTSANSPISVRPVEISITLFSDGDPLPDSFELAINENKTITAMLEITDLESFMDGNLINNASIFYIVYNASNQEQVFKHESLNFTANGVYIFNVSTSIEGDFKVELIVEHLNHTLISTPQFLFDTGLELTILSMTIDSQFRISQNSLKVAAGENITFTILFENLTVMESLSIKIGEVELLYYDLGGGLYLVNNMAIGFPLGLNEIIVTGKQESHRENEISLQLEIIDYWDTRLEILVPPVIYPWSNISTFKIRYKCFEFPRENEPLIGAFIGNLTLTREIEGDLITILVLDSTTRGVNWGWTDLLNGDYSIWINTSIVSVFGQSVIYATPFINYEEYRAATVEPYVWVRPVETQMTIFTTSALNETLDKVELFLDQNQTLYSYLNISDSVSVLYSNYLEGATIYYEIYQSYQNGSQRLYESGSFAAEGFGIYYFTLRARDLGNYVVNLRSVLENYTVAEYSFEYTILEIPIVLADQNNIIGTVISTPQNYGVQFTLQLYDYVHDVPLEGAIIRVDFEEDTYYFYGDSQGNYIVNFSVETLARYEIGGHNLEIQISKANYTFESIFISFNIELPVDQYFNIPYLYWIFIGSTALLVSSVVVTNRIIKNARIPLFVKQILKTKKIINKEGEILIPEIAMERNEEYVDKYRHLWTELDLDLEKIMEEK